MTAFSGEATNYARRYSGLPLSAELAAGPRLHSYGSGPTELLRATQLDLFAALVVARKPPKGFSALPRSAVHAKVAE